MMTEEQFESIKAIWHDYKCDDSYNTIGKLNLVAVLGERAGLMIAEIERLRVETKRYQGECEWQEQPEYWHTACGKDFVYDSGTPSENSARFCQFCGKVLVEKPAVESAE